MHIYKYLCIICLILALFSIYAISTYICKGTYIYVHNFSNFYLEHKQNKIEISQTIYMLNWAVTTCWQNIYTHFREIWIYLYIYINMYAQKPLLDFLLQKLFLLLFTNHLLITDFFRICWPECASQLLSYEICMHICTRMWVNIRN